MKEMLSESYWEWEGFCMELGMAKEIPMSGQAKTGEVLRDQHKEMVLYFIKFPLRWVEVCELPDNVSFVLGPYKFN